MRAVLAIAPLLLLSLCPSQAARASICPAPPPCPPPVDTTCVGVTETTITISTVSCFGDVDSVTESMEETVGGPTGTDICVGAEKGVGFHVCPGTVNTDFNTETVTRGGTVFADGFE